MTTPNDPSWMSGRQSQHTSFQDPKSGVTGALGVAFGLDRNYQLVTVAATPGTGDASTAWQAALNLAQTATGPIRIIALPGSYTVRNLRIYANTWLDLAGVTLAHGGANGTVAPLESIQTTLYAEGTAGALVGGIRITGGTIQGARTGTDYSTHTGADAQDALQLNYCDSPLIDGVKFIDHNQDAIVLANGQGGTVTRCTFVNVCDGAIELRYGVGYRILNNRATLVKDFVPCKPDVEDVVVSGNTVTCYSYGVAHLARGWRIVDNDFSAASTPDGINGANTGHGLYIIRHPSLPATTNTIEDVEIRGNRLRGWTGSNARGVLVSAANGQTLNRIIVADNTISNCWIGVETEGETQIVGNSIAATQSAVKLSGPNCGIANNRMQVNGQTSNIAIDATNTIAVEAVINSNRVTSTGTSSPSISVSADRATINDNRVVGVTSTGQCILVSASDCAVTGNVVSGHNHGIRLAGNRNVVTSNRCRDAAFNGVQTMAGATSNLIAANTLLNNTTPLTDAGTTTTAVNNVTA